ncbi:MAG: transposase [Pseudomonadales bacterium]|nr:transposase [Pseudomonadales bacterium]
MSNCELSLFKDTDEMATPRHQLVDPNQALCYHIVSRCVRRSWLCGFDRLTGRDYSHRKEWLLERLSRLASAFSVDVYAYSIMSNHFHLVLHYDPHAGDEWTDHEVVDRWLRVCPPKVHEGRIDQKYHDVIRQAILSDQARVESLRLKLCSLSVFMKLLKQPIARRANLEDDCSGHFFEQRFYSCALLDESSVLAAMAYVDLNPIRAKIAKTITESEHTSIQVRCRDLDDSSLVEDRVKPLFAGVKLQPLVKTSLSEYVTYVQALTPSRQSRWPSEKLSRWRAQVAAVQRKPRAVGAFAILKQWHDQRGWMAPRELLSG